MIKDSDFIVEHSYDEKTDVHTMKVIYIVECTRTWGGHVGRYASVDWRKHVTEQMFEIIRHQVYGKLVRYFPPKLKEMVCAAFDFNGPKAMDVAREISEHIQKYLRNTGD
jgi:hypothetical protein